MLIDHQDSMAEQVLLMGQEKRMSSDLIKEELNKMLHGPPQSPAKIWPSNQKQHANHKHAGKVYHESQELKIEEANRCRTVPTHHSLDLKHQLDELVKIGENPRLKEEDQTRRRNTKSFTTNELPYRSQSQYCIPEELTHEAKANKARIPYPKTMSGNQAK